MYKQSARTEQCLHSEKVRERVCHLTEHDVPERYQDGSAQNSSSTVSLTTVLTAPEMDQVG